MRLSTPKILVIRFSSIGDIVLTTPVIRCLKRQLNAEVHFLTKKAYQAVIAANPYLDKIYTIKKHVNEVAQELKLEHYDVVVDLHNNLRTLQLKRMLGVKSYVFDKINSRKWLMVNLKINLLPPIHIVDRYLATVEDLEVQNDGHGLDYFIEPENEVKLPSEQIPYNAFAYIAFVIGAAHPTKCLPIDKCIELSKKLSSPIVLLGGPAEAEQGQQIAEAAGKHVVNLCGRLNLNQSASIIQQAGMVISNDTGLMHIAAAFRRPIFSIWGNTIPAFGMYPYYPTGLDKNTIFEITNLSCRPCSKIGYSSCPKKHFKCMRLIDVDQITAELQRLSF